MLECKNSNIDRPPIIRDMDNLTGYLVGRVSRVSQGRRYLGVWFERFQRRCCVKLNGEGRIHALCKSP